MNIYLACLLFGLLQVYIKLISAQRRGCRDLTNNYWKDGAVVPFNCPSGYELVGAKTARCNNGVWNPPRPTCRKTCLRPSFLDFDLIIRPSKLTYSIGNVITYSCKEGHRLHGVKKATCTKKGFVPSGPPGCEELLQCHTEKQTVCEPSGPDCNTRAPSSENKQRDFQYCNGNARFCFIYRFGVEGNRVTVNTTTSGCVTNEALDIKYGCYDRSYLGRVDPSGVSKLSKLETTLGTRADDVQVCVCDRDACNESVETAARNEGTTTPIKMKMILGSLMGCLSLLASGF